MNTANQSEQSAVGDAAYETLCLYIDDEFIAGGGRKEQDVVNPANGRVIGKLPHASKEDLEDRKSTRLNSSHVSESRMPSSA